MPTPRKAITSMARSFLIVGLLIFLTLVLLSPHFFKSTKTRQLIQNKNKTIELIDSLIVSNFESGQDITIDQVTVNQPSFVVIFKEEITPKSVLGVSTLLVKGKISNLEIKLFKITIINDVLQIALYQDNGDGVFDLQMDTPAKDKMGNNIFVTVVIGGEGASIPYI